MMILTSALFFLTSGAITAVAAGNASCKSLPGDPDWPSDGDWSSLNQTVGGRLIATVPVASVCHSGGPFDGRYNATECAYLKALWNYSQAHYPFPGEVSFPFAQNQSCDPYTPKTKPCDLGHYASYSINVTGAADIAAGIDFARRNNVRLVIKNTGHDYLGKSTGKGGLALWTHNLKTREFIEAYSSDYYKGPALKLGAGVQGFEAYETANKHGRTVVGGTCATVGIVGGYSQGGGHSTLSGLYGLSADNVLEWEVVTADGKHLVATPTSNQDLYWALAGGGGGTFAVVLSMTTRLHPDSPIGGAYLRFDDEQIGSEAYWDAVGVFHAGLSPILRTGTTILYSIYNSTFSMFDFTAPNKTTNEVILLLQPILSELDKRGVPFIFEAHSSPTFLEHFAQDFGPLPYGPFTSGQVTSSRLVPRSVVQDPEQNSMLTSALRNTTANGDFFLACQALDLSANVSVAANAVLPAWREAASHCIVVGPWDYTADLSVAGSENRMAAKEAALTDVVTPQLEAVTPGSGTYLNEANFRQNNFQQNFYGANYPRLLEVKRKYDPENVFYAVTAVGSEDFVVDDCTGRLCRTST